jgi:putative transposase
MDFVAQRLADGRWIRVLTDVDQYTCECLTLHADTALSGEKVAAALDKIVVSCQSHGALCSRHGEASRT